MRRSRSTVTRSDSSSVADWSSATGRVVLLQAGRATLELLDEAQAETIDSIEAGGRVTGTVRLALEVADSERLRGGSSRRAPRRSRRR